MPVRWSARAPCSALLLALLLALSAAPALAHKSWKTLAHKGSRFGKRPIWKKGWVHDSGPDSLDMGITIAAYIPLARQEAWMNVQGPGGTPETHGKWDTWQLHKLWLESQCFAARQAHGVERPVKCVALVPAEASLPMDDWTVTPLKNQVRGRESGHSRPHTRVIWGPTETFRCKGVHPRARNAHRFRCFAQFLRAEAASQSFAFAAAFIDTSVAMFYNISEVFEDNPPDWSAAFVTRPEVDHKDGGLIPSLEALAPLDARIILTNVGRAREAADIFEDLDAIVENVVMEDCRVAPRPEWTAESEEAAKLAETEDAINNHTYARDSIVEAELAWSADALALGVMAKEVGVQLLSENQERPGRRPHRSRSFFGRRSLLLKPKFKPKDDTYRAGGEELDPLELVPGRCNAFSVRVHSDMHAPLGSEAHPGAEVAKAAIASGPSEDESRATSLPIEKLLGLPFTWATSAAGTERTHQIRLLPGIVWSVPPRSAIGTSRVIELRNSPFNTSELAECRRAGGVVRCFDAHEADLQRYWRTAFVEDRRIPAAYGVHNADCCNAGGRHIPLARHVHTFWAHHLNRLERYDCLMEKRAERVSQRWLGMGKWAMRECPGGHMYERLENAWQPFRFVLGDAAYYNKQHKSPHDAAHAAIAREESYFFKLRAAQSRAASESVRAAQFRTSP